MRMQYTVLYSVRAALHSTWRSSVCGEIRVPHAPPGGLADPSTHTDPSPTGGGGWPWGLQLEKGEYLYTTVLSESFSSLANFSTFSLIITKPIDPHNLANSSLDFMPSNGTGFRGGVAKWFSFQIARLQKTLCRKYNVLLIFNYNHRLVFSTPLQTCIQLIWKKCQIW